METGNMIKTKHTLLTGLIVLVFSSQSALAQYPTPYGYNQYPAQGYNQYPAQGYSQNRPTPGYRAPYGYNNYNPYARPGYGYRPNNNSGFNRFFNNGPFNGNNRPFSGNSNFGEELWPGRGSIYDDVLPASGPWNRNWGRAPWNRDYDDMWGKNGGPTEWFDPRDPKEGAAQAWEDMLYTPNALGTMPGGWKAPSITVPNPVDVGDEFKNTARDMPDEMQNFTEGFTYGDGYDDYNGYRGNPDRGGIQFNPNRYRRQ